jgi:hypothetical protein
VYSKTQLVQASKKLSKIAFLCVVTYQLFTLPLLPLEERYQLIVVICSIHVVEGLVYAPFPC